jgi:Spy/CpxP family protein refolding chaperone
MMSCGCASRRAEYYGGAPRHHHFADPGAEGGGRAGFGVRRPLRFLAWRLELREEQVTELAGVLQALKTERAQGEVDDRRSVAALADAVAGETYDAARAKEAVALRVASAERVQSHVAQALERIHALLDPEQRARLAYLIRTGTVVL